MDNKNILISFDFDGTLSLEKVQFVAKELIDAGFSIKCTTARRIVDKNQDLWEVVNDLGITNVTFTELNYKYPFMQGVDVHVDNCVKELELINRFSQTFILDVINPMWEEILKDTINY